MKNKVKIALTFFISLAFCACQEQSATNEIHKLQRQAKADIKAMQHIEKEYYAEANEDYHFCDSMLQFVPKEKLEEYFNTLNLAQAYLIQFQEVKPVMERKFDYLQQQLKNLHNDIATNYVNDSLANIYLSDEQKVADTLHEQVLYFSDRLSAQKNELNSLRKAMKQ